MKPASDPHYRHRFPAEIISHAVWLYFRFSVSFRDVEEMVASRGILVSYETTRRWCDKFGNKFANGLRSRRPRTGDKWHLDEVFLKINGTKRPEVLSHVDLEKKLGREYTIFGFATSLRSTLIGQRRLEGMEHCMAFSAARVAGSVTSASHWPSW